MRSSSRPSGRLWPESTPAAVDALVAVLAGEPVALGLRSPTFSLRSEPRRRPLRRFVARALIHFLVLGMLPPEWQVRAVLWPAFAMLAAQRIGVPGVQWKEAAVASGAPDVLLAARDGFRASVAPEGGGEKGGNDAAAAEHRRATSKGRRTVFAGDTLHGIGGARLAADRVTAGCGRGTCTCTAPAARRCGAAVRGRAIEIKVYKLVDGARVDTRGLVAGAGQKLLIGLTPRSGAVLRGVTVQEQDQTFMVDSLKGEPNGADWIVEYTPGKVGTYRVEATGIRAASDGSAEKVVSSLAFRVLGDGGPGESDPKSRPYVLGDQTAPRNGATGVPVSSYMEIVFSEPVKKLVGFKDGKLEYHVALLDPENKSVPLKLSGIDRDGNPIDDIQSEGAVVTGITVQPRVGLRYGVLYRLKLSDQITDLGNDPPTPPAPPIPSALVPYETSFTTFSPEAIPQPEDAPTFGSPGLLVLKDRGYLVAGDPFVAGSQRLRAFDLQDPANPAEIDSAQYMMFPLTKEVAGEADSPLGERIVAAIGPATMWGHLNLFLYDVSNDAQTKRIGAVSLTSSLTEGSINRACMRAGMVYAATFKAGIR